MTPSRLALWLSLPLALVLPALALPGCHHTVDVHHTHRIERPVGPLPKIDVNIHGPFRPAR